MAINPDYQDMVEKVDKILLAEKLMAETRGMMSKEGYILYPSPSLPKPSVYEDKEIKTAMRKLEPFPSEYILEDLYKVFNRLLHQVLRNVRYGEYNEAKITEVLYEFVELAIKRLER